MLTTDSLKICFFNSNKAWGGGEKWHFDMACHLNSQGYKVIFFANEKSELAQRLKDTSIPTYTVKIDNLSFLNIIKIYRLRSFFNKKNVSVIVMNLPSDVKTAGTAAKLAGLKHIIYRRGIAFPIKNSFLNRFLFRNVITHVIANSEATKNSILEKNPTLVSKEKISVIYNGLDFSKYNACDLKSLFSRDSSEIILGNAGRMVHQKGHEYLIEVASLLKHQRVKFKMLLAGSGPLEEKIKMMVKQNNLEKEMVFMGFIEDIPSFMHSIDVFLLSSRWEGFGFVLTEAMAASKPIVAFNISSNPELVNHGKTGFLAKAFKTEEFAGYVAALARDKKLREDFGKAGFALAKNKFSFDRAVHEFLELIK